MVQNQERGETYKLIMPEFGWLNGILELGAWENVSFQVQIKSKGIVGKVFWILDEIIFAGMMIFYVIPIAFYVKALFL